MTFTLLLNIFLTIKNFFTIFLAYIENSSGLCKIKPKNFIFTKEEFYEIENNKSPFFRGNFIPAAFAFNDSGARIQRTGGN